MAPAAAAKADPCVRHAFDSAYSHRGSSVVVADDDGVTDRTPRQPIGPKGTVHTVYTHSHASGGG